MWTMAVAALATIPIAGPLLVDACRGDARRRAAPGGGAERAQPARAARDRIARPQLLVPARRVLHLRLSHLVSRHAPARRSEALQPPRFGGRGLAGHHRPRQRGGQPHGRLGRRRHAHEVAAVRDVLQPRASRWPSTSPRPRPRSRSICSPPCWVSPGSPPCRRPPGSSASCLACAISRPCSASPRSRTRSADSSAPWLGGKALHRLR